MLTTLRQGLQKTHHYEFQVSKCCAEGYLRLEFAVETFQLRRGEMKKVEHISPHDISTEVEHQVTQVRPLRTADQEDVTSTHHTHRQ